MPDDDDELAMTKDDLERDLAACESVAHSPPPWLYSSKRHSVETTQLGNDGVAYGYDCWGPDDPDDAGSTKNVAIGRFIADAREGWPRALREVDRLREQLALATERLNHYVTMDKIHAVSDKMASFVEQVAFSHGEVIQRLRVQLGEVRAARDEACAMALEAPSRGGRMRTRIDHLRAAGDDKP